MIALSESDRLNLSRIIHPLNLLPMRPRRRSSTEGTEGRKSGISSAHIPSSPPSCARSGARSLQRFFNGGRLMSAHGPAHANSQPLHPPPPPHPSSPLPTVWPGVTFFPTFFSPCPSLMVLAGEAVVTEGVSLPPSPPPSLRCGSSCHSVPPLGCSARSDRPLAFISSQTLLHLAKNSATFLSTSLNLNDREHYLHETVHIKQ